MEKKGGVEEVWGMLKTNLEDIMKMKSMTVEYWMNMYTVVHNHCSGSGSRTAQSPSANRGGKTGGAFFGGEDLYNKLVEFLKEHVKEIYMKCKELMGESLLVTYKAEWESFTAAMQKVNHIFTYLNRHWVKREAEDGRREVYEVYHLALVTWRENFFVHILTRLTHALLAQIERDRSGEQIDDSLIKAITECYVSLGLTKEKPDEPTLTTYKRNFETDLLDQTELYYTQESTQFLTSNSVADYMIKCETRLEEEQRRVNRYLHPSSQHELIHRLEQVLIQRQIENLQAEFNMFLENDKEKDLSRMYNLLKRLEKGVNPLKEQFGAYVEKMGLKAIQACANQALKEPKIYVEELLKVFRTFYDYVQKPFQNDPEFQAMLDKACRKFVNNNEVCKIAKSPSKSPELIARYTDEILKNTATVTDTDLETTLNDIMIIFRYIEEKDVFMQFYSRSLARRLIQSTSASEDMEDLMIGKLKTACGYEYTAKLQRMFSNIRVSRDLNEQFEKWCNEKEENTGITFSVQVLTTGSWPLQSPPTDFSPPPDLLHPQDLFSKYYLSKYSGRKLTWLYQWSKGEIKVAPKLMDKPYTFQCSTFQMALLLLFNANALLKYDEFKELTKLSDETLQQVVKTLLKTRILMSSPPYKDEKSEDSKTASSQTIDSTWKFKINQKFSKPKLKLNINITLKTVREKDEGEGYSDIEQDRKWQIQAAIVRVMKMRKRLQHQNLISEVVEQLQKRFKPSVPMIKKCIDMLIDKEYLERDPDDRKYYRYLA